MALHIVRSLGQAFDVCHKLNPKPKKKKESESTEEDSAPAVTGEGESQNNEEGDQEEVAKTPDTWKQFSTDLDSAMGKLTVSEETTLTTELDFDPFATPPPPITSALGNGVDPFQPPVTHPPLAVGNSTTLPDFPTGVDPSTVTVPPAHMHLLTGPPAANGQVF